MVINFREQVYQFVARIPPGRVVTYGQIAEWLGAPRSARRVGQALGSLPPDRLVPWHRVVNRAGRISQRWPAARMDEQAHLLRMEGVTFDAAGVIDLARYRWLPPVDEAVEQVRQHSVLSAQYEQVGD